MVVGLNVHRRIVNPCGVADPQALLLVSDDGAGGKEAARLFSFRSHLGRTIQVVLAFSVITRIEVFVIDIYVLAIGEGQLHVVRPLAIGILAQFLASGIAYDIASIVVVEETIVIILGVEVE